MSIAKEGIEKVMKQVVKTVMWLEEIGFHQYELKPENVFISDLRTLTTKINLITLRCLLADKSCPWSNTQKSIYDRKGELYKIARSMLPDITGFSTT